MQLLQHRKAARAHTHLSISALWKMALAFCSSIRAIDSRYDAGTRVRFDRTRVAIKLAEP